MTSKKYKPPRMIQARHKSFNIKYGRFIKPLEIKITKYGRYKHCFGKGNYDEIGTRISKLAHKYKYYTELDHDSFDAHVTVKMLELTHNFYVSCYPDYEKELRKLCNKTIVNNCVSRTGDKYQVRGTRMSGDVDTSLGNSLVNYAILKECLSILKIKGDVIVNGDDSIIFTTKPLTTEFVTLLRKFNMESKVKPSEVNIHKVEFCRTKLIINDLGHYTMMMDPDRIQSVYGMTYRNIESHQQYLIETAYCNASINKSNPLGVLWYELYERICDKPFGITQVSAALETFKNLDPNLRRVLLREAGIQACTGECTQTALQAYPSIMQFKSNIDRHIKRIHSYFSGPHIGIQTLYEHGYVKRTLLIDHRTRNLTRLN